MIINSITLKNFKSYEDETTFIFSPNDDKNIILIGGENGAGKSTLFEAIKLCMYGPTNYGYIGYNHNYLTKIKNNINDNAFKNKDVNAFISIDITFKDKTLLKRYTLKRSWSYSNQKLSEDFIVYLDGNKLNNEDTLYFDKYLRSVLPPSLFNFFFFDGEELSDFFTSSSSNLNLKDSILQLFNYDTFDILKKHLTSYQRSQANSNAKLKDLQTNYDNISLIVSILKKDIEMLNSSISSYEEELDNLKIKKLKIENDFKNSGGLLEEEKKKLNNIINNLENERFNINQNIKDSCNDIIPFLLIPDLLVLVKNQIKDEELLNSYLSINDKLTGTIIKESITNYIEINENDNIFNDIANSVVEKMFDISKIKNTANILELSAEDKNNVIFKINSILDNQNNLKTSIINKFNRIHEINTEIKNLREKLNSSVSEDILNNYIESIHLVVNEINEIEIKIFQCKSKLETKMQDLHNKEYHLTRAKNAYLALLQDNNIFEISTNIIDYLKDLLSILTKDKINLIEKNFLDIFSSIIRKENYISSISIDENFNSTLYITKDYTVYEILNIINNIGFDELSKKYGPKFIENLYELYNVSNNDNLLIKLNNDIALNSLKLSTKVNINDFSNGEKQVYILCLIWAIIKSSGVEIPFIIDTPYARIDESHRNSLTNIYLPNISKQVIILSTNKEIDSNLYKTIKPHVCNEYLLIYNTKDRKTEVKKGYFEV